MTITNIYTENYLDVMIGLKEIIIRKSNFF